VELFYGLQTSLLPGLKIEIVKFACFYYGVILSRLKCKVESLYNDPSEINATSQLNQC
jgi:hypothetical protein